MDQAERKILDMIEQGALTAEEGLRLIDAMNVGKSEGDDLYNLSPEEVTRAEADAGKEAEMAAAPPSPVG